MSWKNVPDDTSPSPPTRRTPRAARSLATRLTAWYAGSAFALIFATTSFLYWVLSSSLDRNDDHLLADQVHVLRAVLLQRPGDWEAVKWEAEEEFENRQHTQVYVRVLDEGRQIRVETPGMERVLPATLFGTPAAEPGVGSDLRSPNGRSFRVLAIQVVDDATGRSSGVIQVGMDRSREVAVLADYRNRLWAVHGVALLVCIVDPENWTTS